VATVNGLSGVGAVVVGGSVVADGNVVVVLVGAVAAGGAVVVVGGRVVVVPGAPMAADVGGGAVLIRTMPARLSGGGSSGDAQAIGMTSSAHPIQRAAW
jgi:hypothetical protein